MVLLEPPGFDIRSSEGMDINELGEVVGIFSEREHPRLRHGFYYSSALLAERHPSRTHERMNALDLCEWDTIACFRGSELQPWILTDSHGFDIDIIRENPCESVASRF